MPTPAERHALVFIAAVALVGAGARLAATTRFERAVAHGERGIAYGRNDSTALNRQIAAVDSARAAPSGRSRARRRPPTTPALRQRDAPRAVDVNTEPAAELERLPRIGPALARRIVAYREEHGPFGSMDDLRHVHGIGVTTATLLAPLVTFSSGYRPFQSETRPARRDFAPSMN